MEDMIFEPRSNHKNSPKQNAIYDCAVIGAGVAGFSASMYAARLGLKTMCIGEMQGGTVTLTTEIENYPGFVSITGQKLSELLYNHAMDYDVHYTIDKIETLQKPSKKTKYFTLKTSAKTFFAKTVLLATGTTDRKLGILGEKEFIGNGVSYCALCDLTFTKGKQIAVIGGGDSAIKEANLLAKYAKKIYLITIEDKFHAEKPNLSTLNKHIKSGKIVPITKNTAQEIVGNKKIEKLILKKPFKKSKELKVNMVFVYIGNVPNSSLAKQIGAKLNKNRKVIIAKDCSTSLRGFFAAGDVTDTDWKQAINAAAQGAHAAYSAYNYISKRIKK